MVLSRCAGIFRSVKISRLRKIFDENEVKHAIYRETQCFRYLSTDNNTDISSTSENSAKSIIPIFTSKSTEDQLNLTSQAASDFSPSVSENLPKSDCFGRNYYTFEDCSSELEIYDNIKMPGALDTCVGDISHVAPYIVPSFNFAAYADDSPLIQELAKLGVNLHRVEKKPHAMEMLLQKKFEDLKPHIRFLHDTGVEANEIGNFITKNPMIVTQDLDDLHTRIRYLRAHEFNREMVARIISKNPFWLMFDTRKIDGRLGYFQREFHLNGYNIRHLATKQPKLITYSFKSLIPNIFAIREEMGFNDLEVKQILLEKPKLFMKMREKIVEVFDYVHNTMKIPHEIITKQPGILTCRLARLQQRHQFLVFIGKVQYDPTKPMYVSPLALVSGTDTEFCHNIAKTTVETYNLFLKTL